MTKISAAKNGSQCGKQSATLNEHNKKETKHL